MAVLQQIKVPLISVNDTSLTVVDISFEYGAAVKKGDLLMVFETSKTTYDVLAEADGFVEYLCSEDEDYDVNVLVANIYNDKLELPAKPVSSKMVSDNFSISNFQPEAAATWRGETLFSAAAVELMKTNNISHTVFAGRDFVSKKDVELLTGAGKENAISNASPAVQKKSVSIPIDTTKVIVEKLSSNKKREIEYLSSVQAAGLTSTINMAVDTQGIFVHINRSLQFLKNSLLPVIIYESARLLQKYPALNAYFTGDAVAFYKEVNIGFAIDIDKGLKVLKIADTPSKEILQIEGEIMELSGKYLDDNLHVNDLVDIGFTITDLSAEGVVFFRPLINMMNSAILGVSSIDARQQQCILSLTFDHRVTEGKLAAKFLHELKLRLESYQSKHFPLLNQDISCFKCFKNLQEDLSDVGFAKCITPKGEEAYICQSCLKGF